MKAAIRSAEAADAHQISRLCLQLGYKSEEEALRERLSVLLPQADQAVYIAWSQENEVIGWIQVCEVNHLMEDRFAEVVGLVVADKWRNQGVGALLMETAENWARQKSLNRIWIRSNVKREKAHNFYKRLGYKEIKKQAVLVKDLT